jgi:hypothetical protein
MTPEQVIKAIEEVHEEIKGYNKEDRIVILQLLITIYSKVG